MNKAKIAYIFSTRNAVFPEKGIIDAPNFIGGVIAEEINKKGYDVSVLAAKNNHCQVHNFIESKFNPFFKDFSLEEWSKLDDWTKIYCLSLYDQELLSDFLQSDHHLYDLIHFQTHDFYTTLPFVKNLPQPKIFSLHNIVNTFQRNLFLKYANYYPYLSNSHFIAVSKFQANQLDLLDKTRVIYHGTNIQEIKYNEQPNENICFCSRISKNKGIDLALKTAVLLRKKIIFCGRKSTENVNFFDQELLPLIDNLNVVYIDNTERKEALELFKQSKVFLFPIQWDEPFGLVMIESMACGTPVIAFARGSVPEVIKDGETGFIVNPSDEDIRGNWLVKKTGIEGLCEAVERLYALSEQEYRQMRQNCRAHVEKNFTVEKMVDEYEKVYKQILEK